MRMNSFQKLDSLNSPLFSRAKILYTSSLGNSIFHDFLAVAKISDKDTDTTV